MTTRVTAGGSSIGHHHVAFLRAWLEGVELRSAWQHYVAGSDDPVDLRTVEARRKELLDELLRAAQRAVRTRPDAALERSLQVLSTDAKPEPAAVVPTLQEWMDAAGIDADFYSEAELIQEYQQAHGIGAVPEEGPLAVGGGSPDRVRALNALAAVVATRPAASDPVGSWFEPKLAARLAQCAHTLEDLARFIGRHGPRWHGAVAGLGARRAAGVVAWMRGMLPSLEQWLAPALLRPRRFTLGDRSVLPAPSPALGVVPIERLDVSSAGLGWVKDEAAVREWLSSMVPGSATWRSYRREAERLLLWCMLVRRRTFSELTRDDAAAFERFLAAPPADWVEPRPVDRLDAAWRPFRGALSESSLAQALVVLRVLWRRLTERGLVQPGVFDLPRERPALPCRAHPDPARLSQLLEQLRPGPRRDRLVALAAAWSEGRLAKALPLPAAVAIAAPPPRWTGAGGAQRLVRASRALTVSRAGSLRAWRRFVRRALTAAGPASGLESSLATRSRDP